MGNIFLTINIVASIATTIGVIFAIIIYFLWEKDYKLQISHKYALDLLKKIKCLHFEIESLRSPKFHYKETVVDDIKNHFIPKIKEQIFKKALKIQVDLLVAKNKLVKNNDLQSIFNEKIQKKILERISKDVYLFEYERDISYDSLKKLDLWTIIFPSEGQLKYKIKASVLGIGTEVIDDDFNQEIEECFEILYKALQENMV